MFDPLSHVWKDDALRKSIQYRTWKSGHPVRRCPSRHNDSQKSLEFVCPVHSRKCDFRPRRSATKFKANQWARYELYATILGSWGKNDALMRLVPCTQYGSPSSGFPRRRLTSPQRRLRWLRSFPNPRTRAEVQGSVILASQLLIRVSDAECAPTTGVITWWC